MYYAQTEKSLHCEWKEASWLSLLVQFLNGEREINIAFSFRLVTTVLCPEAGLNQGRLLKLDLGYTEPGEQVKVDSGCHTCCVY